MINFACISSIFTFRSCFWPARVERIQVTDVNGAWTVWNLTKYNCGFVVEKIVISISLFRSSFAKRFAETMQWWSYLSTRSCDCSLRYCKGKLHLFPFGSRLTFSSAKYILKLLLLLSLDVVWYSSGLKVQHDYIKELKLSRTGSMQWRRIMHKHFTTIDPKQFSQIPFWLNQSAQQSLPGNFPTSVIQVSLSMWSQSGKSSTKSKKVRTGWGKKCVSQYFHLETMQQLVYCNMLAQKSDNYSYIICFRENKSQMQEKNHPKTFMNFWEPARLKPHSILIS